MRPGLVAIDEIFVGNFIERLPFVWLEEETREFVAREVIQSSQHNFIKVVRLSQENQTIWRAGNGDEHFLCQLP